jgi:diguanylate cyclase (GGDEF)-like protein
MNSEVNVPKKQAQWNLGALALSFIQSCPEKTFRYLWIGVCTLLALVAVLNFYQTREIQADMVKRRLLEVSLQDLIVQSTALQQLNKIHNYETKLGLEVRGYNSPQELLNQLAARLAVIEAIDQTNHLALHTHSLREQLIGIDQIINNTSGKNLEFMDQWFLQLSHLNNAIKNNVLTSDARVNELQRNNLILTLIVLFFSVGFVTITLWRQSRLHQRFAIELSQLSTQARTDSLTGLLNRRGWKDITDSYLRKMQRESHVQGSVAIIDIDYFKQYNDTFGHEAGDVRLREFAETLKTNFRPGDSIARVGGEEFAVLLPNCVSEDAQRIVDRIRLGNQCKVAFSAGICDIARSENVERIMAIADQALYQAKNKGRNQSCLGNV